jgi:hypothetical protein
MTADDSNSAQFRQIIRWSAALIGLLLLVALLTSIAVSPVPMRGAELFGVLARKIKGNPGATAFLVFTALGLLWLGIGMFTAAQEWLAARHRAP